MADNPKLKKKDGDTVSWQKHEIDYVTKQLAKEFPNRSGMEISLAVGSCKAVIQPSEKRDKLMACARHQLR